MNNNWMSKKRRKNNTRFTKRKRTNLKCIHCNDTFYEIQDFRSHLQNNPDCKTHHPFSCKRCGYVAINDNGLATHINQKQLCKSVYDQMKVTTGQMQDTTKFSLVNRTIDKHGNKSSTYNINEASGIGIHDSINLTLVDTTTKNRTNMKQVANRNNDYETYMKNSRQIASLENNQFSSVFNLQQHDNNTDIDSDIFCIDEVSKNLPSYCLPISEHQHGNHISGDNEENSSCSSIESTHIEEVSFNQDNNDLLDMNDINNDPVETNEQRIEGISNNPIDVRQTQLSMSKKYARLTLNDSEKMLMDLFHMHKASNAPLILFDRTIDWIRHHQLTIQRCGTNSLSNRKAFIRDMNLKMYENPRFMKPVVQPIALSSGRISSVVTFSLQQAIIRMVSNKSLFCPENLLLNPDNPFQKQVESEFYGDVNSGTWFKEACNNECSLPNHILMPFCYFIDGLKADKFGKLTIEAVLACCLWFNHKARNRASTWWVSGFVQDQQLFRDQGGYIRNDKAQDYHDMLFHIFKEMKDIRDRGGIQLTLDFGNEKKYDVIAIPVIQYIIGDCKGNDLLCGRMGSHSTAMGGLCRDCNISPSDGDDTCVGKELICSFHKLENLQNQSEASLKQKSFLFIKNCFYKLSFGGCPRNIFGATPAEILHAIELGLCMYIADSIEITFTQSAIDLISQTVVGIVLNHRRQSERDLPNLSTFKQGLISVKSLKAKERFARVYCFYLALSNSYVIDALCSKRRKKLPSDNGHRDTPLFTRDFLRSYYNVIEDTLLFHEWLKQDLFRKTDFETPQDNSDCRAMARIKLYLEAFKQNIHRGGNNLSTPKFHQMLHVVDYIIRHGSPRNYDGSRGENFGKVKIKDNAKLTNRQRDTINFDISTRIAEEDVIDQVSNVHYHNTGNWPSSYCNDQDLVKDTTSDRMSNSPSNNCIHLGRARFHVHSNIVSVEETLSHETIDVIIDWGGKSRTPLLNFPHEVLKTVSSRLYIGSPNIGGKVDHNSVIPGYTEIVHKNITYRCHPCYSKKGCWYDWAYFKWQGYDDPIPGRLMMVLDFTKANIIYDTDENPDAEGGANDIPNNVYHHLTNDVWVVVLVAESTTIPDGENTDSHFDSKIHRRVKLHDDKDMWMIPLSCIVGPCFVVYNKNYTNSAYDDVQDDRTAYIVEPMCKWGERFLPKQIE
jgi:hypothetical protein